MDSHDPAQAPARPKLYAQVAELLLQRIQSGDWPVGSSLPSESMLIEQTGVSRHTLRHALKLLQDRGFIERQQGAASKVLSATEPRIYSQDFHNLHDVLRYPRNTLRENKLTRYIECDESLQPTLRAPVGSSWFQIGAVRRQEGFSRPMAWTDIYILSRFAKVAKLKDHQKSMVFEQIQRQFGVSIDRAQIEVSASTLSAEHAAHLGVRPGTPCLVIVRRYYDSDGQPFEITVTRHLQDQFTFTMELRNLSRPANS